MEYVKLRSWHIVRGWSRVPGRFITLCGRVGFGSVAETFGDQKTCESCLRINAKIVAADALLESES